MTDATTSAASQQSRRIRRTVVVCVGAIVGMTGLSFAAVPFYDLFCRMTGFGGTPIVGSSPSGQILDRTVEVRFDANVAPGLSWRFTPETPEITVRIGEMTTVMYRIRNAGAAAATGIATFNVQPAVAGAYFVKLQCFCFSEHTLQAGEDMESAVVFYVDPAIADDPNLTDLRTITLSYTYFPARDAQPVVTRAATPGKPNL